MRIDTSKTMSDSIEIVLDDIPVTFTSSGKIHVMDAISALAETDAADIVWEALKEKNPQIDAYIEYLDIPGEQDVPVTDSEGWVRIQTLLFEHLMEMVN